MGNIMGVIITPFLLASLLAIVFSPLVNYLEKQGLSRGAGIVAVYLFLIALSLLFCLDLVPALLDELQELLMVLPEYADRLLAFSEKMTRSYRRFALPQGVRQAMDENIRQWQQGLVINLENFSQLLVILMGQALGALLIPIFLFYLLRD
ncbi:MAG: AI-2E family transporter, partial [Dethiobacteria bacterium]